MLKLGMIGAGFISRFQAVAMEQVRGLERMGGIMVYDVTFPWHPFFVQYITTRDFGGDLAPEGIIFIPWWLSTATTRSCATPPACRSRQIDTGVMGKLQVQRRR